MRSATRSTAASADPADPVGSARPLVLFTDLTDLDPAPATLILENHGIRTEVLRTDGDGSIVAEQRGACALIVGYREITAELMAQLPELAVIGTTSNGVDMIDLGHAEARGVWVTNVGHAATEEVAVHTLSLILAALRRLRHGHAVSAAGGWTTEVTEVPRRASELTLGIVGFGRIGETLARIAAPLFHRVVAHDPSRSEGSGGVVFQPLDTLLAEADIISLHLPLTERTRHILDARSFALMRPGAMLVNVSRGALVDEAALIGALDAGILAAACLDVLDAEPPAADHPFRTDTRVLLTPHVAFLSDASLRQYEETAARNIAAWWHEGRPPEWVLRGREGQRPVAHDPAARAGSMPASATPPDQMSEPAPTDTGSCS